MIGSNGNAALLAEFIGHCHSEKGLTLSTVRSYERHLSQFLQALDKPLPHTREDFRNFLSGLNPELSGNVHYELNKKASRSSYARKRERERATA